MLATGKESIVSGRGEKFGEKFDFEVRNEFKKVTPQIPYIGGDANPFTSNSCSVQFLAPYRVMRRKGIDKDEGGVVSLKLFRARLHNLTHSENNAPKPDDDNTYLWQLKKWASVSRKRLNS
jgi:hypothetical protein